MIFFKVNYLFGGSHFYRLLWVLQNLIVLLSRASVSVACLAIIFCGACEEFFMFVINWNQLFFWAADVKQCITERVIWLLWYLISGLFY